MWNFQHIFERVVLNPHLRILQKIIQFRKRKKGEIRDLINDRYRYQIVWTALPISTFLSLKFFFWGFVLWMLVMLVLTTFPTYTPAHSPWLHIASQTLFTTKGNYPPKQKVQTRWNSWTETMWGGTRIKSQTRWTVCKLPLVCSNCSNHRGEMVGVMAIPPGNIQGSLVEHRLPRPI